MIEDLTYNEKKAHTDSALAYLLKHNAGNPMSIEEISDFTGLKRVKVKKYYLSGLSKLRSLLDEDEIMLLLEDVKDE